MSASVLARYGFSGRAQMTPLEGGLINGTYRVEEAGRRVVLQRLHAIFAPTVNLDIQAITDHLAAQGLNTQRVIPTEDGALWVIDEQGATWRMLSWLEGHTVSVIERPAQAYSAARWVARFHGALRDFTHRFHFTRPGAHDTPLHLSKLEAALCAHKAHANYDEAASLAAEILSRARALPALPKEPLRIVHGDLKISNVLFQQDEAIALLDLDTMAELTIPIELGDALRSWCNPSGEDATRAEVRLDVFEAALTGYAEDARWLTVEEREALVLGFETISLELAARFCADALNESYFGWNPKKFASRSLHNLARAESQLSLATSVAKHRPALEQIVRARFAGHASPARG
ncbi:MAG TPA: phosphotransferase [Polyangiales bacterium]